MINQKPLGKRLATSAQLAVVALLTLGLATNTHDSVADTLSSPKMTVPVAAPSIEDLATADRVARLDYAMGALSERQANIYRVIFAAQAKKDWARADDLIDDLKDLRLMGHVLADRFESRGASLVELASWLKAYPRLPEAKTLYKKAKAAGGKNLTKPRAPRAWLTGGELDKAADFTPYVLGDGEKLTSKQKGRVRSLRRMIRKGRPTQAVKSLAKTTLPVSVRADLEGMIAASYFHHDMKDKAADFAKRSAKYSRPLGLWISGMLAWGQSDHELAHSLFERLAASSKLTLNNRSAAHFWAYRAATAVGEEDEAEKHINIAAQDRRSFYGMMAMKLVGRNPVANMSAYDAPEWNEEARATIKESQAGWRALALIQVGQKARAEAELRRLNPRRDSSKKNAMIALAMKAKMPALALQVAYLTKNHGINSSLYPVLPWVPEGGFQVDRALLFALARQESRFDPKAKSSAGAQGLMQIMPATAKGMMRKNPRGLAMVKDDMLLDPRFNIALGQKYIRTLTRYPKVGKNLVMILASYNAGPNKATSWMKRHNGNDPLYFLETIPVKETRHYVARVLAHYWAYRSRLGKSVPSLKQMASGGWPHAPLDVTPTLRVARR